MKVSILIKLLQQADPEATVHALGFIEDFGYDYLPIREYFTKGNDALGQQVENLIQEGDILLTGGCSENLNISQ